MGEGESGRVGVGAHADFSEETTKSKEETLFAVNTSIKLFIASVIISGICKLLTV